MAAIGKYRSCALLSALAAVCLAGPRASAQSFEDVKIGIPSPLNTVLAFWMADQAGFYKDEGIKVEFKSTQGGSLGAAMIQSGDIQVMQVGMSSVIDINRSGGDIRTIASLSNVNRFTLFGAPGVKSAANLKGGAVAISSAGSETDTTTSIVLDKLGLKRSDVTIKEVGSGGARLAALKSGKAQASLLNDRARRSRVSRACPSSSIWRPTTFPGCSAASSSRRAICKRIGR
jgi:ABC-type nitrate/sulfonate/bicarbonate transport system substrate-binding protein